MNNPASDLTVSFRNVMKRWGNENIRPYPWRFVSQSYLVLVSEFMLHRTQVKQVLSVYNGFTLHYPDLESFSHAEPIELAGLLKPLGLHWRIDGMILALKSLWLKYEEVPLDLDALRSIIGIGPYIANATVCFVKNIPLPLVDTNTVRVIGRLWGLDVSGEARRRASMIKLITAVCDPYDARHYYYSLIDLAHVLCTSRNPKCEQCPLRDLPCQFGLMNAPDERN